MSHAQTRQQMRSLWVQGYTVEAVQQEHQNDEFPVGTGIYRKKKRYFFIRVGVPCRYRDIPNKQQLSTDEILSSL